MNYADIKNYDISNGEGIRVSLFVSGCSHHCDGCFNKEAWDFNYGLPFDLDAQNKIIKMMDNDYIAGISLLGGEPLEKTNIHALLPFIKKIKEIYPNKNVWCYSGYTLEQLLERNDQETLEILKHIDILVDGKFIQSLYDLTLRFRGSSNQRIIDIKKTFNEKKIILYSD